MTRKQLRILLEGFGIDPSFRIIRSEDEKGTIKCLDKKTRNETVKILKEHKFHLPHHTNDSMNIYKYGTSIDFDIPVEYQVKKEKTYMDILGDMENSLEMKHMNTNRLSD